jgi:N-acetylglutamate synthase-like GNAT family acetyltransferase
MSSNLTIERLTPSDKNLISEIAKWYFEEWTIPTATTVHRLATQSKDDVLFQLILNKDNKLIATGGLYNNVGLLQEHVKFKKFKPWVALLFTEKENRNQGMGRILLTEIEAAAKEMGLNKIYLFTFTAEALYQRSGWTQLERVNYKGHDTVIMAKAI